MIENTAATNMVYLSQHEDELEITDADLAKIKTIRARYAKMREEIGKSLIGTPVFKNITAEFKATQE